MKTKLKHGAHAGHRGPRSQRNAPSKQPRPRMISKDVGRPQDLLVAAVLSLLPQLRPLAHSGRQECGDNGALLVILDETCTEAITDYVPHDRLGLLFHAFDDPTLERSYDGFERAGVTADRRRIVTFARLQQSDGSAKNITMMLSLV